MHWVQLKISNVNVINNENNKTEEMRHQQILFRLKLNQDTIDRSTAPIFGRPLISNTSPQHMKQTLLCAYFNEITLPQHKTLKPLKTQHIKSHVDSERNA